VKRLAKTEKSTREPKEYMYYSSRSGPLLDHKGMPLEHDSWYVRTSRTVQPSGRRVIQKLKDTPKDSKIVEKALLNQGVFIVDLKSLKSRPADISKPAPAKVFEPLSPEKQAAGQKIIGAWRSGLIEFSDERDFMLAREGLKPEDFGLKSYSESVKELKSRSRRSSLEIE
jgi:hypothetical protein